jgi:hypothetical protein
MNWYEYLGTMLLLTGFSLLPIFAISIYAILINDIKRKKFFIFVGSLLSYGVIGIFSVATIPLEFIWNGVLNQLFCLSDKPNIICKAGHFALDYGYMILLLFWLLTSIYIVQILATKYWHSISRVTIEDQNANK